MPCISIIGSNIGALPVVLEEMDEKVTRSYGRTFKLLGGAGSSFDYAVFADGEDESAKTICLMAYIAIAEAKVYFEANYDKCTFIKNVISDNILSGDIYVRAKELNFDMDVSRAVLVIRQIGMMDAAAIKLMQGLFPDKQRDFVVTVGESEIALVKEVAPAVDSKHLQKLAESVEQSFYDELGIKTVIGIGSPARHLRELADRYKEAQVAIKIGKVFEPEKTIINYESLGIGRLIYQLPTTLCEMFLSEVFKKNPIESLDQETLFTISKFFENNLNVSETSRKLFVHRNTLVYRLEKIKKLTGLDLREFDHAIVFKVALMVKKYLNSHESRF